MGNTSVNKPTITNNSDDINLDDLIIAQTSAVSYTIQAIGYIAAANARNSTKIPPKTRITIAKILDNATKRINLLPRNMRIEIILLIHKGVNIPNLTTILTNYVNTLNPDDSSTKYLEIIVEVFKTADAGTFSPPILTKDPSETEGRLHSGETVHDGQGQTVSKKQQRGRKTKTQ